MRLKAPKRREGSQGANVAWSERPVGLVGEGSWRERQEIRALTAKTVTARLVATQSKQMPRPSRTLEVTRCPVSPTCVSPPSPESGSLTFAFGQLAAERSGRLGVIASLLTSPPPLPRKGEGEGCRARITGCGGETERRGQFEMQGVSLTKRRRECSCTREPSGVLPTPPQGMAGRTLFLSC
ncbi:hypothetical protein KIL84_014506 [Mauremys mutica]|uniref:Uncharacterized protein n=1 Tax=Mauremys mutica TaxID=74926 RepID=A0A9D3XRG1_9SAUR|nr:hypothetical protein KIL84_014506 [Mauremys mutica]